jgi:hypothetical protein
MDGVLLKGDDKAVRKRLPWVIWAAVVVAGLVSSFQIWVRAFDAGPGITAGMPHSVAPTGNRQVPAIFGRSTAPHGATAPTNKRQSTPSGPAAPLQSSSGSGTSLSVAGGPTAALASPAVQTGQSVTETALAARSRGAAPSSPTTKIPTPGPSPVITQPVTAPPNGPATVVVTPVVATPVVMQAPVALQTPTVTSKKAKKAANDAKKATARAKHEAEKQAKLQAKAAELARHEAEKQAKQEAEQSTKSVEHAKKPDERAQHEAEKRAKHDAEQAKKAAARVQHDAERARHEAEEQAKRDAEKARHDAEKAQHDAEKAQHDAEKAQHEAEEQARRDAEKAQHDADKAQHDAEKAQHDAEKAQHDADSEAKPDKPPKPDKH